MLQFAGWGGFDGEVTSYLQRPRTVAQPLLTSPPWHLVSTGTCSWQLMMRDPKHLGLVTQASQSLEIGLKLKKGIITHLPAFTTISNSGSFFALLGCA